MIKRPYFILLIAFVLVTGCQKKAVQLALIDIPGLSEIQNHSSIWIFMEAENGDTIARMNKNNKILNTHWIFNIDRRLRMKEVVPLLIKMQENRNKDSMHKKEGMNNYFSYADTSSENISLALFTQITFKLNSDATTTVNSHVGDSCSIIVEIKDKLVKINDQIITLDELQTVLKEEKKNKIVEEFKVILAYDDQTLFQDYLHTKVYLMANEILCDSIEYLYTVK